MLPQTNLQLYRLLIESRWSDDDLVRIRSAYDLARQLFGHCYRPSQKAFICHLIGTAGALARWGERPDMVLAGLLHSAYLYGDFRDGQSGASPRRRAYLVDKMGCDAEQLVLGYTQNRRKQFDRLDDRDLRVLELADLLDEFVDAGPAFAVGKPLKQSLNAESADRICASARDWVHSDAENDFRLAIDCLDTVSVPTSLTSNERSFVRLKPGAVDLKRSRIGQRLARFTSRFSGDRKAA